MKISDSASLEDVIFKVIKLALNLMRVPVIYGKYRGSTAISIE